MNELEHRLRQVDADLAAMYGPKVLAPHGDAVGELMHIILTQNTSDANSDRTYAALRKSFSSWDQLAGASPSRIADVIRMGGLADIKAARIIEVLARLKAERGSITLEGIDKLPKGEAFHKLTELPGVGPKTAACVLLFALGVPVFPVDTHVHRVANRLGLVNTKSPAATQDRLMPAVPDDITYQLHMNMVTHGRKTCRAQRPRCDECLLAPACGYAVRASGASEEARD